MENETNREYLKDKSNLLLCGNLGQIIKDTKEILNFISDNASFALIMNINYKTFEIGAANLISCMKTLDNILFCCENCSFSDANVLLRKYRDDMFQYLYFLKIIKESTKYTLNLNSMPKKLKSRIEAAHLWAQNDFIKSPNHVLKNYIRAVEYKNFLQSDHEIKRCCEQFFNKTWEDIDSKANNYVHSNGRVCVVENFSDIFQTRKRCIDEISKNIMLVSIYFISLLLLIDSSLFASSDYTDYLDFNLQPPEGSQYWISPVFQDYFDKYINKLSPTLLDYLRTNNSHCMIIN